MVDVMKYFYTSLLNKDLKKKKKALYGKNKK